MYAFYLSCSSATFALQHGGFVPREWLAAEKSDEDKKENMQKTFKSLLFRYFCFKNFRQGIPRSGIYVQFIV